MVASGLLGFDGEGYFWQKPWKYLGLIDPSLFTVVTKTLTLQSREGNYRWYNPMGSIRLCRGGVVNTVGLSNPGIDWWCRNVGPKVDSKKIPLVVSVFGEPEELQKMARRLNNYDLVGIELNVSCPIAEKKGTEKVVESCRVIKESSNLPLILKLSVIHDMESIIRGTESYIEAISINSVPWKIVFPDKISPLAKQGDGGVSGEVIQPYTWKMVRNITDFTCIPVIGPSVWEYEDLRRIRDFGAKAVSFGSVFRYPWRPTLYVRREIKDKLIKLSGI